MKNIKFLIGLSIGFFVGLNFTFEKLYPIPISISNDNSSTLKIAQHYLIDQKITNNWWVSDLKINNDTTIFFFREGDCIEKERYYFWGLSMFGSSCPSLPIKISVYENKVITGSK